MNYNYHAHTYRCGHASGTPEEYIERAIQCGVTHMGFSDHMAHICADGSEASFRVPFTDAKEYISEISSLREKYADKIDIKIGFEMEYYPECFESMLRDARNFGAEYLILGQHYTCEEYTGMPHTMKPTEDTTYLHDYVSCVVAAMKSGAFTYVAHPDIINFTGDKELFKKASREICVASRAFNVPLEINFLGIRGNRNYPNDMFWEIAGEEHSPVTFGFDAHETENAFDAASLKKAKNMVEKYNLNYIGKPELRLIQNMK